MHTNACDEVCRFLSALPPLRCFYLCASRAFLRYFVNIGVCLKRDVKSMPFRLQSTGLWKMRGSRAGDTIWVAPSVGVMSDFGKLTFFRAIMVVSLLAFLSGSLVPLSHSGNLCTADRKYLCYSMTHQHTSRCDREIPHPPRGIWTH